MTTTATLGELRRAAGRGFGIQRAGTVTAPTLTAGAFTIVTGLTNVRFFRVNPRSGPQVNDRAFELVCTVSGGTITVTVKITTVSAVAPVWANAVTADVAAAVFAWSAVGS